MRTTSLKQHNICIYKTCIQSPLLQSVQQYTSTSRRLFIPRFNCAPIINSEHRRGLDCVSRQSRTFSLVASKGFTVHSRRSHSRQNQTQSISNDCQSNHEKHELNQSPKYFEIHPSQLWNIENFGGGSVNCPKIIESKDARLIIATRAAPRS